MIILCLFAPRLFISAAARPLPSSIALSSKRANAEQDEGRGGRISRKLVAARERGTEALAHATKRAAARARLAPSSLRRRHEREPR